MKFLKSFTTACLVYSLISVSGLEIIQTAQANVVSDQVSGAAEEYMQSDSKTYHHTKKKVDENGNKYTSQNFQGEGEDKMAMADYLAMLTMLAMGVVASSLAKAKPMTTDIMLGAGSGAAYIGAEIYAMIAYDNIDVDQQVEVKMNETGEVDHEQLKTLEKQKQSYLNIEDTAKVKSMIQAAATVGFMGAAGVAAYWSLKTNSTLRDCATAAALCPLGGPVAAQVASIKSADAQIMPSCVQQGQLLALYGTMQEGATAAAGACSTTNGAASAQLAQCVVSSGVDMAQLVCASHIQLSKLGVSVEPNSLERNKVVKEALMGLYPELSREMVDEASIAAAKIFETERMGININRHVKVNELNLDRYIVLRESNRYANGELKSLGIDQYQVLRESFGEEQVAKNSFELKAVLAASLEQGLNLIFPSAQAKMASGVGVGLALVGLVYGLSGEGFQVIDRFMATPGHRALVWGGIAAMAAGTSILSKQIADKMSGNAKRIDDIIKSMRRLDDTGKIHGIGGAEGTSQKLTQTIVNPLKPVQVDPTGITKLPCVGGGEPPCKSISGNLDKTAGFIELQSNPLGQLAGQTGQFVDGIQGQSTLTSGTLENAQKLANQKEAVGKRNKKLFDELNKLRLKDRKKPINFEKDSERLAGALMRAAKKELKNDPMGARRLFASLAPTLPAENIEEELAKEEEAAGEDVSTENTASATFQGNNKANDSGFSFDFGDEQGNTVIEGTETAELPEVIEGETGNDIIDKPGVPIWKIISVRYMKSGFPRLLDLKQ